MTQYDDSLLASELFFLFLTPFVYIYQSQVIKKLTEEKLYHIKTLPFIISKLLKCCFYRELFIFT